MWLICPASVTCRSYGCMRHALFQPTPVNFDGSVDPVVDGWWSAAFNQHPARIFLRFGQSIRADTKSCNRQFEVSHVGKGREDRWTLLVQFLCASSLTEYQDRSSMQELHGHPHSVFNRDVIIRISIECYHFVKIASDFILRISPAYHSRHISVELAWRVHSRVFVEITRPISSLWSMRTVAAIPKFDERRLWCGAEVKNKKKMLIHKKRTSTSGAT